MGKGRAPCCDKNQVKRGPWSPAEDLRLITFIQKHGHDNWRSLPKQAGLLRCGKSCRLRWINYLRPDVKRGNFTHDEEDTIIKLHKAWGNKWSKIASRLPGRTDNEIKNVWNTHLKKRLQPTKDSDNISGDDEFKQSPTTSSSSSSSLLSSNESQDLVAERIGCQPNIESMVQQGLLLHGREVTNNEQFSPQLTDDRKEQTSCSVLSFESTNTSNSSSQADTLWPEDPLMESQFEFVEININSSTVEEDEVEKKKKKKKHNELELESESPGNIGIEIPFECDIDFWNMLDLDNIDLLQSEEAEVITRETDQSCGGSNFGVAEGEELENNKWFKYLENELGLDQQLPKTGEENMDLIMTEDSGETERFVDSQVLDWSKSNPEVDNDDDDDDNGCMAYFQMGSPLSPHQP